jgi:hypothetical protein
LYTGLPVHRWFSPRQLSFRHWIFFFLDETGPNVMAQSIKGYWMKTFTTTPHIDHHIFKKKLHADT